MKRTFSPAQLDAGLAHLELELHAGDAVLRAARTLAQELGLIAAVSDLAERGTRRGG